MFITREQSDTITTYMRNRFDEWYHPNFPVLSTCSCGGILRYDGNVDPEIAFAFALIRKGYAMAIAEAQSLTWMQFEMKKHIPLICDCTKTVVGVDNSLVEAAFASITISKPPERRYDTCRTCNKQLVQDPPPRFHLDMNCFCRLCYGMASTYPQNEYSESPQVSVILALIKQGMEIRRWEAQNINCGNRNIIPYACQCVCDHTWVELSPDEARKNGRAHYGNCWHVYVCSKCKTFTSADSSD